MLILSAKDAASLAKPKSMGRRKEKIFRLKPQRPPKIKQNSEDVEQIEFFKYVTLCYPRLRPVCFHIANQAYFMPDYSDPEYHAAKAVGRKHPISGKKFLAMGVTPGVVDICCSFPRGKYHGLYIEMKAVDGDPAKPEQVFFMNEVIKLGYHAATAFGWLQAKAIFEEYEKIK